MRAGENSSIINDNDLRKTMKWQPIEDAPNDDTIVDLWCANEFDFNDQRHVSMQRVDLGEGNVFYEPVNAGVTCVRDATHFMIVEPPPESGQIKTTENK